MASIDDIANDSNWKPFSDEPIASLLVEIHTTLGREREITDATVAVRAVENGLLYAVALDNNGMPVFGRGSYLVNDFPKGHSPYQLINLGRRDREFIPGFSATFEYKSGKTPNGLDEARLEYTIWHNPVHGLTILTSLHAYQSIEKGWIDLQLNIPTYENSSRAMTMEISSLGESLRFDKDGNLEKPVPRLFWSSKELERIYRTVINGAQADPLQTAVALINGFPSQRPLQIEKLVQYTNQIQKK